MCFYLLVEKQMLLCLCEWKTEAGEFVLNQERLTYTFSHAAVCKAYPVLFFGIWFTASGFPLCFSWSDKFSTPT